MTRLETIQIMMMLQAGFRKFYKDIDPEIQRAEVNIWEKAFEHDPYEVVEIAVQQLINTQKFPPSIAEVKEQISILSDTSPQTAEEALESVSKAVRYLGYMRGTEAKQSLSELAWRTVEAMGGWQDRCNLPNDDIGTYRAQFKGIYNGLCQRQKQTEASAQVKAILEAMKNPQMQAPFITPEKIKNAMDQQRREGDRA